MIDRIYDLILRVDRAVCRALEQIDRLGLGCLVLAAILAAILGLMYLLSRCLW